MRFWRLVASRGGLFHLPEKSCDFNRNKRHWHRTSARVHFEEYSRNFAKNAKTMPEYRSKKQYSGIKKPRNKLFRGIGWGIGIRT